MKIKLLFSFALLLCVALHGFAAERLAGDTSTDRAAALIEKLAAGFRAMGSYRVDFVVQTGGHDITGNYAVSGVNYYIAVGDAEVFGAGKERYEIDNRRREVTLVEVDPASRNLLDNPVYAFDFLSSQYNAALVLEGDGRSAVRLTPTVGAGSIAGVVTVTIDTKTMHPVSLVYDYDGDPVHITISTIAPLKVPLKSYNKSRYADYEVIDFR